MHYLDNGFLQEAMALWLRAMGALNFIISYTPSFEMQSSQTALQLNVTVHCNSLIRSLCEIFVSSYIWDHTCHSLGVLLNPLDYMKECGDLKTEILEAHLTSNTCSSS